MANETGMDTTARARSVQYKNRLYGANGRNRLRKYDGVAWAKAGIKRYRFVPTVAAGAAGQISGSYRYFVVPVNTKHFNPLGRAVAGIPSHVSEEIAVTSKQITVSDIPATHPDSQVNAWYIFRCKDGVYDTDLDDESQDFFYVGQVAIGTTTYTDDLPDEGLHGAERIRWNQAVPATFKSCQIYGERMFGLGFDPIEAGTATKANATVNNKEMTNNIATLTTASAHGFSVGQWVTVGISDADFDGAYQIKATPTTTTFTYWRKRGPNKKDVVSAAATGVAQVIDFAGVTLPDGVEGCWFKVDDDDTLYRLLNRNSGTQVALDRVYTAAMSGVGYKIFRYPWEIYFSEFQDVEAAGPDGEAFRNRRELPGQDAAVAMAQFQSNLLVFSPNNIYSISGKGPMNSDVMLRPDPLFKGIGAVGPEAVAAVDDEVYGCSLRGPFRLRPGQAPELIGQPLLTDWLESLDSSEQALICVGGYGNCVWFWYPVPGETENSKCWRFERDTNSWWPEDGAHPSFFFHDDGDDGVQDQLFFAQQNVMFQPRRQDGITLDVLDLMYTGTVASATTTSATLDVSGGSLVTNTLVESYVYFYRGASATHAPTLVGKRRITANTGTVVQWDASGPGGGSLDVQANDVFYAGYINWRWKTKSYEMAGHTQRVQRASVAAMPSDVPGNGGNGWLNGAIIKRDYVNGANPEDAEHLLNFTDASRPHRVFDINHRCVDYAMELESPGGAKMRYVLIRTDPKATENK